MFGRIFQPSIFYTCCIQFRVTEGLEPIPAAIGREVGYTLARLSVHYRATQRLTKQPTMHDHTLSWGQFRATTELTNIWTVGGLEYLERTQTYMGRTCKLHTERPQLGFEPETFLQIGATVLTTTVPCSPSAKFRHFDTSFFLLNF